MAWGLGLLRVSPSYLRENLLNETGACDFQYKSFIFQSQSEHRTQCKFTLPATFMFEQSVNHIIIYNNMQADVVLSAWRRTRGCKYETTKHLPIW